MNDDLYKNKYRTKSVRLQNWDYSSSGAYFVTICTQNRIHYFGEIIGNKMNYTELGFIAKASWIAMERVFPVIMTNACVIMPNHCHFLFSINNEKNDYTVNEYQKMIKNSVSLIINHFKGRVTKYSKKENIDFKWQPKFYEHVVRDEYDFNRIKNYINLNIENWSDDRFYK